MKKKPSFVGSAPRVWKIRPMFELCKAKAMEVPRFPKVISINVENANDGNCFLPFFASITVHFLQVKAGQTRL